MTFEMKMQEERNAAYDAGREEGRCEGIAAGAEHKSVETARNMLAEGFPVDQTARITGLSPERVRQLAAETGIC